MADKMSLRLLGWRARLQPVFGMIPATGPQTSQVEARWRYLETL